MTIWEDISRHIHKIVSCVLTIPFVELCPNRHRPPLHSSAHIGRPRLQTQYVREVIALFHLSFSKNKPQTKSIGSEELRRQREWGGGGEYSSTDTNCIKSNIYIASPKIEVQHCMQSEL